METVQVTVNYRRQVQPKQYETAAFEMTIASTFNSDMSPSEIEEAAKSLAQVVKVGVYRELGLSFEQNEDTRVIMEVFPNSEVVTEKPKASTAADVPTEPAVAPSVPQRTPGAPATAKKGPNAAQPATADPVTAAWEDVAVNPHDWFYNAPEDKKNPKGPDFKNKSGKFKQAGTNYNIGLWLNTKPEDLVLPDDGYAA